MTISVALSTDKASWISAIIRACQGTPYSHTFFKCGEQPLLGPVVMQADSGGVEITSYARFDFTTNAVVEEIVPNARGQALLELGIRRAADVLNSAYDFPGLLGMGWVELMWRAFKFKVKNPLHKVGTYFCSAFCIVVAQLGGWPGANDVDAASCDNQRMRDFFLADLSLIESHIISSS